MDRMEYNPPVFKKTMSTGAQPITSDEGQNSNPYTSASRPVPPFSAFSQNDPNLDTVDAGPSRFKPTDFQHGPQMSSSGGRGEGHGGLSANDSGKFDTHSHQAIPDQKDQRPLDVKKKRKSGEQFGYGSDPGYASTEGEGKAKKTRQSQSCDACRARKVKCDRPPPGSLSFQVQHKDICSHCEHLGLKCRWKGRPKFEGPDSNQADWQALRHGSLMKKIGTFEYKPKKRGPPNMYMRRLQDEHQTPVSRSRSPPRSQPYPPPISLTNPTGDPYYEGGELPSGSSGYEGKPPLTTAGEWELSIPTGVSAHTSEGPGNSGSISQTNPYLDPRSATSSPAQGSHRYLPQVHHGPPSGPSAYGITPSHSPVPGLASSSKAHTPSTLNPTYSYPTPYSSPRYTKPIYMFVEHPDNPSNPLDAIVPRQTLYQILDLFFDYIYCLTPCLHRPNFTHDINTKREEKPGQEEWTSLVLMIVASTLCQLPRSFVSMTRAQVKQLVLACHEHVKRYIDKDFDELTTTRCIILYHSLFVYRMMGRTLVSHGQLGVLNAHLQALRANEERGYESLNPLDRILKRRIFWLMYGADMSVAAIEGTPVFYHDDDCSDVALPEAIDDEFVNEQEIISQPEGYTPILSGFYYISKLFRITGQLLDKHRRDKRRPPHGLLLQMRLNEVNELYERTMTLMDHCPAPLRLEFRSGTRSVQSLSPGWDAKARHDIAAIFSDPNFDREIVKDYFLVQQANIYVTQQLVRFMIVQYREELYELQRTDELKATDIINPSSISPSTGLIQPHEQHEQDDRAHSGEKDEVILDLLSILQKIPVKVLAVNSFPIVAKVQYIASTLLDSVDNPLDNPKSGMSATLIPSVLETKAQKAQRNLWQFLNILTEIESLYSLEDAPLTRGLT